MSATEMFRGHVGMYPDQQYFITGAPQTLVHQNSFVSKQQTSPSCSMSSSRRRNLTTNRKRLTGLPQQGEGMLMKVNQRVKSKQRRRNANWV